MPIREALFIMAKWFLVSSAPPEHLEAPSCGLVQQLNGPGSSNGRNGTSALSRPLKTTSRSLRCGQFLYSTTRGHHCSSSNIYPPHTPLSPFFVLFFMNSIMLALWNGNILPERLLRVARRPVNTLSKSTIFSFILAKKQN